MTSPAAESKRLADRPWCVKPWCAPFLVFLVACEGLDTSFVGPQPQYVRSTATQASSSVDWLGERIVVTNANGNIEVVGVPSAKRIEVDAYPAALATNQADADAAMADVAAQITVTKSDDVYVIACPSARVDHGSALTGGTGCDRLVVHVPSGSDGQPASIDVDARFGGAKIDGVIGSLRAIASFDVHASVSPTKDATVSVVNGNDGSTLTCPVVLVVPSSFETSGLLVTSHLENGSHEAIGRAISDFPDLVTMRCEAAALRGTFRTIYPGAGPYPCISSPASHGQGTARAAQIEVLAGLGDAYILEDASRGPGWSGGRCK